MNASHPTQATDGDQERDTLRRVLKRCSDATCAAALEYRRTRSPASVPQITVGILAHYAEPDRRSRLANPDPALRLTEDLGLDSLDKFQAVMLLEEVLQLTIDDRVLAEMHTLGDVVRLTTRTAVDRAPDEIQRRTGTLQPAR